MNTNDSRWPVVYLEVKAFVNVLVSLSPRYVSLRSKEGETASATVEVRSGLEKPLTLTPFQFNLDEKLKYTVNEVEKGRRFLVHFTTIPTPPQSYHGFLVFKTNYPERPTISIRIRGHIVEAKK